MLMSVANQISNKHGKLYQIRSSENRDQRDNSPSTNKLATQRPFVDSQNAEQARHW